MTQRLLPRFMVPSMLALVMVGCTDPVGDDVTSTPSTTGEIPMMTAATVVPTVLTSLPREGEADTYPAPDLQGLPLNDVLAWAEASGLTRVSVFGSDDDVEQTSEFDPQRLILVVEDDFVILASFG